MGGNALKNYGVKRVDRATYTRIRDVVLEQLSTVCTQAKVPYSLDDKLDFGDVDILAIVKEANSDGLRDWLEVTFKPRVILRNSNVWSFNVEDLQVDLITTSKENFDIYFTFLCWGDLSMTMGRISRLYDLKYGIDGLEMPIRDAQTNHVVETILISKDPRKIFEFMGYSFDTWLAGFKDAESLRKYLFSSPRIHQGFLDAASSQTKHRKRDKGTRVLYSAFYDWFELHRSEFPLEAELPIPLTLEAKIDYVEQAFPESKLREKYTLLQKKITERSNAREKFSGKQIQELFPELQGARFGALMDLWTRQWPSSDEQIAYVLTHDVEHLKKLAYAVREKLI